MDGRRIGAQKILDAMIRAFASRRFTKRGKTCGGMGFALLLSAVWLSGEEWREIEATIRMVRETAPDDIGVSYPTAAGTDLPECGVPARHAGELVRQRRSRDDVSGAYPSNFYRALANALHLEVRGGDLSAAWNWCTRWNGIRRARNLNWRRCRREAAFDPRLFPAGRPKEQQIMKPTRLWEFCTLFHLRAKDSMSRSMIRLRSREELFRILSEASRALASTEI